MENDLFIFFLENIIESSKKYWDSISDESKIELTKSIVKHSGLFKDEALREKQIDQFTYEVEK